MFRWALFDALFRTILGIFHRTHALPATPLRFPTTPSGMYRNKLPYSRACAVACVCGAVERVLLPLDGGHGGDAEQRSCAAVLRVARTCRCACIVAAFNYPSCGRKRRCGRPRIRQKRFAATLLVPSTFQLLTCIFGCSSGICTGLARRTGFCDLRFVRLLTRQFSPACWWFGGRALRFGARLRGVLFTYRLLPSMPGPTFVWIITFRAMARQAACAPRAR